VLPPRHRLRDRHDFERVYQQKNAHHGQLVILWLAPQPSPQASRIGIVVSKRVSKRAVDRNRLKRQWRRICRTLLPQIAMGWDMIVVVRQAALNVSDSNCRAELTQLMANAGVIAMPGITEEVFYEGGPHWGDLAINLLLGLTVICLPLTAGAVVRALWLRYRITNRRITVIGGWMGRDRSDVIYSEITKVVTVPRGWGAYGDMVVTLKDGSRLEMRAIPRFREIYAFISAKLNPAAKQVSGAIGS
jgi:ribonuclease P protein component